MHFEQLKIDESSGVGIGALRIGEVIGRPELSELIHSAHIEAIKAYSGKYAPYIGNNDHNSPGVALISEELGEIVTGFEIQNAAYPSSFSSIQTALLNERIQRKGPFSVVVSYREEDSQKTESQISASDLDLLQLFGRSTVYLVEFNQFGFKSAWCMRRDNDTHKFSPYDFKIDPAEFLIDASPQTIADIETDCDYLRRNPIILNVDDYKRRVKAFTTADLNAIYKRVVEPHLTIKKETLFQAIYSAFLASTQAFEPFSNYAVGAAFVSGTDKVIVGANFANPYALSTGRCAERAAMAELFNSGLAFDIEGNIDTPKLLVVVAPKTGEGEDVTPCGECRQALIELGRDLPVLSISPYGHGKFFTKVAPGVDGEDGIVISFSMNDRFETSTKHGSLLSYPFSRESLG